MKQHLRVAILLTAGITAFSALFFSRASSGRDYYQPTLTNPATAAKHVRVKLGTTGEGPRDEARMLSKSLSLDRKTEGFSFAPSAPVAPQAQESRLAPDVVQMVGPVSLDQDLRTLPEIPPGGTRGRGAFNPAHNHARFG